MEILRDQRALITGASSGIGRAMAFSLAQKGCELFLIARREEKLREVQKEIQKLYPDNKVHILASDINRAELLKEISQLTEQRIDILINNAGLALGKERVAEASLEDWNQMIQTNISANFRMVHLVLPWMQKAQKGDIINLCSVAGHYTYQGGAVYCATKHAVKAFTRVLREETCGQNLRVMQISPGMVDTEFSTVRFRGDKELADSVYAKMNPLTPEDVARMMCFMLEQPRHVVIDEIITMPTAQGSPTTVRRET
jgi:3-hydroxy acid dehydrogenase/malonic semialdehyde reductase